MKEPRFHRMLQYHRGLLPNAHLARLEEGVSTIEMANSRYSHKSNIQNYRSGENAVLPPILKLRELLLNGCYWTHAL